jgi:hypothetical protein
MHLAFLSSFATTAIAASVQSHARRAVTDLSFFTCDSAASIAMCSDKPNTTKYSLEGGMVADLVYERALLNLFPSDEVITLEGVTVSSCPKENEQQIKPLCCEKFKKSSIRQTQCHSD